MTENHDYRTPEKGATDWHIPLNENFRQLDTDVAIRDVEKAVSAYTPKVGAVFEATDTGAVYVANGATWIKIESTGNDPTVRSQTYRADSGATARRELVDVFENTGDEPFDYAFDAGDYDVVDLEIDLNDDYGNDTIVTLTADESYDQTLVFGRNVTGHAEFRMRRPFDAQLAVQNFSFVNGVVPDLGSLPETGQFQLVATPRTDKRVTARIAIWGTTYRSG